ncbi:MAG: hypothetical protein KatS3mg021_2622 [Fimbriimonadales bacterium]|nr:DNA helicase IV [bacterium HR14]GIV14340.1 MAG: hypothetical protein KatS3mg021_2622 [Fimbriimonadales bacterium]
MRFKGKVRWLEKEEQELYRIAMDYFRSRARAYSSRIRELQRSWLAIDHLLAKTIRESGWHNIPEVAFFGRIDISFDGFEVESRYIGYAGADIEDTRILDWRTPLADVYYSAYGVGRVSYIADGKVKEVELTLRRKFREHGRTISIISTEHAPLPFYSVPRELPGEVDIKPRKGFSDYLDELLSRTSDALMRDIVKTIDAEQNRAIRTDSRALLVRGGPGTGKTAVALHRIAYLNYQHQNQKPRRAGLQLAYISPTQRLGVYTSGVFRSIPDSIPHFFSIDELMDHYIRMHAQWLPKREQNRIRLESRLQFEERMLSASNDLKRAFQQLNSSDMVGRLVYRLQEVAIERIRNEIGAERIQNLLTDLGEARNQLANLRKELSPYDNSRGVKGILDIVKTVCEHMDNALQLLEELTALTKEQMAQWLSKESVSSLSELTENRIFKEIDNRLNHLVWELPALRELPRLNRSASEIISKYSAELRKVLDMLNPFWLFRSALEVPQIIEFVEQKVGKNAKQILKSFHRDDYEIAYGAKPLVCLFLQSLCSTQESLLSGHAVITIDEAQNLPYSALLFIRRLTGTSSYITVIGDSNQSIATLGSSLHDIERLFDAQAYHLTQVYRSNPHIIRAALVLLNQEQAPNFLMRTTGAMPTVFRGSIEGAANLARDLHVRNKYNSTAIITKTLDEAIRIGEITKLPVAKEDSPSPTTGIFVIPLNLCSGLEFDAVVVANVSDENYDSNSPEDRRRLYVASTRAMHTLVFHQEPNSTSSLIDSLLSRNLVKMHK